MEFLSGMVIGAMSSFTVFGIFHKNYRKNIEKIMCKLEAENRLLKEKLIKYEKLIEKIDGV